MKRELAIIINLDSSKHRKSWFEYQSELPQLVLLNESPIHNYCVY